MYCICTCTVYVLHCLLFIGIFHFSFTSPLVSCTVDVLHFWSIGLQVRVFQSWCIALYLKEKFGLLHCCSNFLLVYCTVGVLNCQCQSKALLMYCTVSLLPCWCIALLVNCTVCALHSQSTALLVYCTDNVLLYLCTGLSYFFTAKFGDRRGCNTLAEKCLYASKLSTNVRKLFLDLGPNDQLVKKKKNQAKQTIEYIGHFIFIYLWNILDYLELFWTNQDHNGPYCAFFCPFWTFLDAIGQGLTIWDNFGLFGINLNNLDDLGLHWTILDDFG